MWTPAPTNTLFSPSVRDWELFEGFDVFEELLVDGGPHVFFEPDSIWASVNEDMSLIFTSWDMFFAASRIAYETPMCFRYELMFSLSKPQTRQLPNICWWGSLSPAWIMLPCSIKLRWNCLTFQRKSVTQKSRLPKLPPYLQRTGNINPILLKTAYGFDEKKSKTENVKTDWMKLVVNPACWNWKTWIFVFLQFSARLRDFVGEFWIFLLCLLCCFSEFYIFPRVLLSGNLGLWVHTRMTEETGKKRCVLTRV